MSDVSAAPRGSSFGPRLVVGLLIVVVLACLGAIGWGQWWLHDQRQADARRTAVLAAAEHGTTLILSYDYRRLTEGRQETEPLLTGGALTQYQGVQAPLTQAAPGLHAVVSAAVKEGTVLNASDNSARVLLFVDQTSTSTKLTAPQLDQSRVVVTLLRSHGSWLIASISAV
jgi:Mce-associated membrane protein